jgi:ABC-type glycerol-3-phosphate transport system permease component
MRRFRAERITIAWFLALLSALPVFFMAWLSILHAEDIQQATFFPQQRVDKVTFYEPLKSKNTGIAATSMGQIYEYSIESDYARKKIADINSIATAYAQSERSFWAFSVNRGLVEINLRRGMEKTTYNWNFFKESYEKFDISRFFASNDILQEHFEWLATSLNNEPAIPNEPKSSKTATVSSLAGIHFYKSEEIIGQLNWILANERVLNSVLDHWKKWDGWLNPQIHILSKIKKNSIREKHLLFRLCLSELFPNKISRFRFFGWQDIWVNQVAISGLSILAASDKVIMGIAGGFFPGIAIFDSETKQLSWVTESTGLPSASIRNIAQISEHEILVAHDMGFSIVLFEAGKVTYNFMYGEYGLPYLDDQRLYIKQSSEDKIYVNYENANFLFDFRKFETLPADENIILSPSISYYYESEKGDMWVGYTDGSLEILDSANNQIMEDLVPKSKGSFQWNNYQDIMKIMPLEQFIRNSVLISLSISLLCTLLAIFPSYAIARLKFFGKSAFSKIILASQVLSSLPFLIPIFVIFIMLQMKSFQMFNNLTTIVLVNIAFFLPLTVQFLINVFRAIPQNLEESARMDGCTPWATFRKIILPAAFPALGACVVYIFLLAWDEILFIWILSADASTATLPVGIRMTVGQLANRPELLMAFSVIASLPPILLFALLRSFLFKDLLKNR